jgi:hypothetical protein
MSLEHELRRLYERAQDAPWPGEQDAYGRFLRRKARRGRTMAAAVALALLLVVGVVGVAPRILPRQDDIRPITPRGNVVQVPDAGFQLVVPRNWTVSRRLTRQASRSAGTAPPSVVGVVLSPRSARLAGATITVTSGSRGTNAPWRSRRPDGRSYLLRQPPGMPGPGQFAVEWPSYCGDPTFSSCAQRPRARVALITGKARPNDAGGQEQVLQAMQQILAELQPITNTMPVSGARIPAETRLLLGTGSSGRTAWELWIEPLGSEGPGIGLHFPWRQRQRPSTGIGWEPLPGYALQRTATQTSASCLSWAPRSKAVLISGVAREDVAGVQIQLWGRAPLHLATFGADKPVPLVAFAAPPLPAGTKLHRIVAYDASGRQISKESSNYGREALCRHSGT